MRTRPRLDLIVVAVILCIVLTLGAVATFARPCAPSHPAAPQTGCGPATP
jgi:hypothetical protein